MTRTRIIIAAMVVISATLLAVILLTVQLNQKSASLLIQVNPTDAIVSLDGKQIATSEKIQLKPGTYAIEATKEGYDPYTTTISLTKDQNSKRTINMVVSKQSTEMDGQLSASKSEASASKVLNAPGSIVNKLPQITESYRIDTGVSKKYPGDATHYGIYISSNDPTSKAAALQWIRTAGYNPDTLEIIYQPYAN